MKQRGIRMSVDPRFHKKLKLEAVKNDRSIIQFTKELADKDDPFIIFGEKKKNDRRNNDFYL